MPCDLWRGQVVHFDGISDSLDQREPRDPGIVFTVPDRSVTPKLALQQPVSNILADREQPSRGALRRVRIEPEIRDELFLREQENAQRVGLAPHLLGMKPIREPANVLAPIEVAVDEPAIAVN